MAPSAVVAIPALSIGAPFSQHPPFAMLPGARGWSVHRTGQKRSLRRRKLHPGLESKGSPAPLCWKAPVRRGAELPLPGRCCPALSGYPWDGPIPLCYQDGRSPAVSKKMSSSGEAGGKAKQPHQDSYLYSHTEMTINLFIYIYIYMSIFNHRVLSQPQHRLLLPSSTFLQQKNSLRS